MARTASTRGSRWRPLPAPRQGGRDGDGRDDAARGAARHVLKGKKGPGSRRGKYGQWERQGNSDQKRMLHAFSVPVSGVQTSVTRRRQLPFKASVDRFTEYVAITLSALSPEFSFFRR